MKIVGSFVAAVAASLVIFLSAFCPAAPSPQQGPGVSLQQKKAGTLCRIPALSCLSFLHVSTLEVLFFKTLPGVFHIYACNLNVHIQNRESGHVFNGRLYPLLYLLADLRNIVAVF